MIQISGIRDPDQTKARELTSNLRSETPAGKNSRRLVRRIFYLPVPSNYNPTIRWDHPTDLGCKLPIMASSDGHTIEGSSALIEFTIIRSDGNLLSVT